MAKTLRILANSAFNTKGSELSWEELDQNLIELYQLLSTAFQTGMVMEYAGSSAPSGWLLLDGSTIGSGSSGADYANSDAEDLFKLLWDNTSNTEYQLLNSGGSSVSRGGSAQDDWDNDRRIPLPDVRGRTTVGSGQGTGLTSRSHLVPYGSEEDDLNHTHSNTLSVDSDGGETVSTTQDGAHTHTGSVDVDSAGSHTHGVNITTDSDGSHSHSGSSISIDYASADFSQLDDHPTVEVASGTGQTVVETGTHSITANPNGGHQHTGSVTVASDGSHTHTTTNETTDSGGSHSHSTSNFTVNSDGAHTHNVTTNNHAHGLSGSIDNALTTVSRSQPSLAINKIIKL